MKVIETFIALRYLLSKHKVNFITIISTLSILGITIGVAALIIVLSVFNGFGTLVSSFLISFDPHVQIEAVNKNGSQKLSEVENFLFEKNVDKISPFVSGKVITVRRKFTQAIQLKGIDSTSGRRVYGIQDKIVLGDYDLTFESIPKAIMGIQLADRLQAMVGDTITIISPSALERAIVQISPPKKYVFIISGIFQTHNKDFDGNLIFTDLTSAQRLLGYRNSFQGYEFRLNDIDQANSFKKKLVSEFGTEDFSINTWYDLHKDLFSVMQIERWTAYLILSLIIAVAVFNILGSLSMSVIEKKRDIGVLISLGIEKESITKIFIYQGLFVGLIGTSVGFILGITVYLIQVNYNIYPLDPNLYIINSLPMELRMSDFVTVGFASIFLSFIASIIPSKKASAVDPLQAIKWE